MHGDIQEVVEVAE